MPDRSPSGEPILEGAIPARSPNVNEDIAFYRNLGFTVDEVYPADDPRTAVVSGHGVRLLLDSASPPLPELRLNRLDGHDIDSLLGVSPGGTRVTSTPRRPTQPRPRLESSLLVNRMADRPAHHPGRAGMRYDDLVPGRQGDCVIASLISIPEAGPVDDWVHFHEIDFQLIFVKEGWVKVVYEDQGPAFVMKAGDCVIQPPTIRHRVLENSDGMEVIEVGYPAEHVTRADPNIELPNSASQVDRRWFGQSFIRHRDEIASWDVVSGGVSRTDCGVASATGGLASVDVTRADAGSSWILPTVPASRFVLLFVLDGVVELAIESLDTRLDAGDSIVVPVGSSGSVHHRTPGRVLRVIIDIPA